MRRGRGSEAGREARAARFVGPRCAPSCGIHLSTTSTTLPFVKLRPPTIITSWIACKGVYCLLFTWRIRTPLDLYSLPAMGIEVSRRSGRRI
jgi:hypothetical protein